MKEALTFDDVLIVPGFSTVSSRKDVDLSFNGSGYPYMDLPIISANMDTVTGVQMAQTMILNGAEACLHRFQSIEDNVKMFHESTLRETGLTRIPMVSIGLGKLELERAEALRDAGAITFVVDVAHGASMSVVEQIYELKKILRENGSIVVGNFATGKSVKTFLEYVTVDGLKIGIGPGSACTTRIKTGCGYPQLSAVMDVVGAVKKTGIPVIADGGMKTSGDIAKALGAGASMIMLGGMLAGTEETPGETFYKAWDCYRGIDVDISESEFKNDEFKDKYEIRSSYKKYRGSASKESYDVQGKNASHRTSEGESFYIPYKGSVKDVLQEIEGGLKSAFSYVGACNLAEFHANVEFVRISNAGYIEGTPHGKKS